MATAVFGSVSQAASGRLLVCAQSGASGGQSPLPLASPITDYWLPITDLRRIRIRFRPEITQNDEVFDRARVFERDTRACRRFRTKHLIISHLHESDQLGTIKCQPVDRAVPLHHDQTVSAVVLDCAFHSGLDGELLRGEELFSTDLSINDPTVDISFGSGISDGHRLKVMVLLEIGI